MTTTVLLIDGDTIAYQAALGAEKYTEWGEGDEMVVSNHADIGEACAAFDAAIARLLEVYSATSYRIALTDSENFRKDILPTYKSKRSKKPMALPGVRKHAVERGAVIKPRLEGDDVLGIWSTHPSMFRPDTRKIIVSIDKDMRCIPGLLSKGDGVVETIERCDADYFHMTQTLTGDVTDGYTGLPGCGPVAAEKVLSQTGEYGAWLPLWPLIVAAYAKKGLTEADALVQARVARILRHTDYNFKTQEPILWTPPTLSK